MDKGKKNQNYSAYVAGSTALKTTGNYAHYKIEREKEIIEKPKQIHVKTNPAYTFALCFAIIGTLVMVMLLLRTQFLVSEASLNVMRLQNELKVVYQENDLLADGINQSMNMHDIYQIATESLGMVRPEKSDIQPIQATKSSFTVQYAPITVPTEKVDVTISNVLGFIK